jgi:hypothetical protein
MRVQLSTDDEEKGGVHPMIAISPIVISDPRLFYGSTIRVEITITPGASASDKPAEPSPTTWGTATAQTTDVTVDHLRIQRKSNTSKTASFPFDLDRQEGEPGWDLDDREAPADESDPFGLSHRRRSSAPESYLKTLGPQISDEMDDEPASIDLSGPVCGSAAQQNQLDSTNLDLPTPISILIRHPTTVAPISPPMSVNVDAATTPSTPDALDDFEEADPDLNQTRPAYDRQRAGFSSARPEISSQNTSQSNCRPRSEGPPLFPMPLKDATISLDDRDHELDQELSLDHVNNKLADWASQSENQDTESVLVATGVPPESEFSDSGPIGLVVIVEDEPADPGAEQSWFEASDGLAKCKGNDARRSIERTTTIRQYSGRDLTFPGAEPPELPRAYTQPNMRISKAGRKGQVPLARQRKFSNLPPFLVHFRDHKDSVAVSRKRLEGLQSQVHNLEDEL